jgi:hypothetical protein
VGPTPQLDGQFPVLKLPIQEGCPDLCTMTETPPVQRIFAELKRRKVFRIAALYGAGAFAVLQAVDIMAEGLALPAAVLTVVTVAVLVGFPLALIAAWVYERRPEGGLKRTEQALSAEIQEIVAPVCADLRTLSGCGAALRTGPL